VLRVHAGCARLPVGMPCWRRARQEFSIGSLIQNLGRTFGFGNGAVDFAGSGVVHMIGGSIALAGAIAVGPRIGRFNKDGSANAMPGHNIPMGVLGTIILFFGWFGFNPGSSLAFTGSGRELAVLAAVNTLLAGAAGGVSSMLYMWWLGPARKPDPGLSVNGILAGLVAITAPCAFVSPLASMVIGLISGVIVCLATFGIEKLHIDDPVGAVPVHFCNGLWGVIAVGLFADGKSNYGGSWNGVAAGCAVSTPLPRAGAAAGEGAERGGGAGTGSITGADAAAGGEGCWSGTAVVVPERITMTSPQALHFILNERPASSSETA